jgi:hypothetical protein
MPTKMNEGIKKTARCRSAACQIYKVWKIKTKKAPNATKKK